MEPDDVTVAILREIRDEIRTTNERLEQTRDEVRTTNERLEQTRDAVKEELAQTREDLGRRITQSEVRTATAIVELAGAVQSVKDLLADRLEPRDRVVKCEQDIAELKRRVGDH